MPATTNSFEDDVQRRLEEIRAQGLHRTLRPVDSPQGTDIVVEGRRLLNFSSNDYLGLAMHPALRQAARDAVETSGAGCGASRLICGSLAPLHELEAALVGFKGCPAALVFSSGYITALGAITALVGRGDFIVIDRLVHACIVDAARLSGAGLRVFEHNDPSHLDRALDRIRSRHAGARVLVVTESVFSMDGDVAPIRELAGVKDRHGAWLMVDEAHATGVFGAGRRGVIEEYDLIGRIEVQMGTLGKAVGSAGGYVAGSKALIELLVNRARSLIFSTAPVPAAAAAARAGIELIRSEEGSRRCANLWRNIDQARERIERSGFARPATRSPILPLRVGDERLAVELASRVRELGIFVPAVRYPAVARGAARLRITLNADHQSEHLDRLEAALREARGVLS